MQTILEQLTQKIESFDSQLHSLALHNSSTAGKKEAQTPGPTSSGEPVTSGEPVSEKEKNKKYLRSLDVAKVSYCMYMYV